MSGGVTKSPRPLVLKFGGELLEDRAHLATVVAAIKALAARTQIVTGNSRLNRSRASEHALWPRW